MTASTPTEEVNKLVKKAETFFGHATETVKPVLEKLRNDVNENLENDGVDVENGEELNNNGSPKESNSPPKQASPNKSRKISPQKHKSREGSVSPRKQPSQETSPKKQANYEEEQTLSSEQKINDESQKEASPQKEENEEKEITISPRKQARSPRKQMSQNQEGNRSPQKQPSQEKEGSPQKQTHSNPGSPTKEETKLNGKQESPRKFPKSGENGQRTRSTSPNKKFQSSKTNPEDSTDEYLDSSPTRIMNGKTQNSGKMRRGSSLGNKEPIHMLHNNSVEDENQVVEPEGVIEGIVNGENEAETLNEQGQGADNSDGKSEDADISSMVESGNMEQLAAVVLNGDGERLVGQQSENPELQSFLENVPIYMVITIA